MGKRVGDGEEGRAWEEGGRSRLGAGKRVRI